MRKIKSSVVFKSYSQQQGLLLPPSLEELIGDDHLVKVVNEVVEQMDLADLINLYAGGVPVPITPGCCLKYYYMRTV